MDGGLPATAQADITVSRASFKAADRDVPVRCLWFAVTPVPESLYDPTADNNVVAVELNVYDNDAKILQTDDEIFIRSLSSTLIKIPRGQMAVSEQVKPTILRAGKRARGQLSLVVHADAFASASDESPRRCTAVLSIAGAADTNPTDNTTRLVVDVLNRNNY